MSRGLRSPDFILRVRGSHGRFQAGERPRRACWKDDSGSIGGDGLGGEELRLGTGKEAIAEREEEGLPGVGSSEDKGGQLDTEPLKLEHGLDWG